jgi:hypothetical protein
MLGGARWGQPVGLNSLKSLNLTNVYPNNKKKNEKKNNNKVKSKPLELRSRVKTCQNYFSQISTFCPILSTLRLAGAHI